jgi:regulatory protein
LQEQLADYADIKSIALRYLVMREHSQKELADKIQAKGFAKSDILPVLTELAEQGWQSDDRYAENYARFRIRKGFGPLAIAYELQQNGIKGVDLDAIMGDLADSWLELLAQVYAKKYRPCSAGAERLSRKEWAKRSRFLLQRGFSGESVATLLDHLNTTLI